MIWVTLRQLGPYVIVHVRDGTGIHEIMNVQVDIERARAEPEHLRDSQIDLGQAIFRPIPGAV